MVHETREELRAAESGGERQVALGRLLQIIDELVRFRLRKPAQQRALLVRPSDPVEELIEVAGDLLRFEGLMLHGVPELWLDRFKISTPDSKSVLGRIDADFL